jgi:phosphoribosyl 1,2-cyclic phosphodiesterase
MKIKLLGVRGSLPTPMGYREYRDKIFKILQQAVRTGLHEHEPIEAFIRDLPDELQYCYGGNTTCATLTSQSGQVVILDCGSGIRALGDELIKGHFGRGEGELDIFITHTHWDHIQGIPFFKPMYIPGNVLNFYSPYEDLEERLKNQMAFEYFPATFEGTASIKNFHLLKQNETIRLGDDLIVDLYPLKHPGDSFAYRFREGNKTIIFATDVEFLGDTFESTGSNIDFFLNADLLILDSQYTLDESFFKFDWGHTSYTVAVNCGIRWKAKNLVLTHHDPSNSDIQLKQIHRNAIDHRNQMKTKKPNIYMAREGMTFHI